MDFQNRILIRGAREHNLKGVTVEIPRNKLTVVTGLSGSGKSSLAFDTLYAEGQRRYVESLSAYARQFLQQMQKPDVESIEGLSPAIAIEQRTSALNPRSTVGTTTEIYDFLRLLYARVGTPHCPKCGQKVSRQTLEEIVNRAMAFPAGSSVQILAPLSHGENRDCHQMLAHARREGFVRVRVNGKVKDLSEKIALRPGRRYAIDVVIDRLKLEKDSRTRVSDSFETALRVGSGLAILEFLEPKRSEETFTEHATCTRCQTSFPEMSPRMFSFNSPYGACPGCHGLGTRFHMDEELVIPNPQKSLSEGAIVPWLVTDVPFLNANKRMLQALVAKYKFDLTEPFAELPEKIRKIILYGTGSDAVRVEFWRNGQKQYREEPFMGVLPALEKRYLETESPYIKGELSRFMNEKVCLECGGKRLRPESLAVKIAGRSIVEVNADPVEKALEFFRTLPLTPKEAKIAEEVLKEISERLRFLINVGLGYLTMDRASSTLSGGEAQRIRLATQIGSRLVGVLYILDEPSIGLHQRDNDRLLDTLKQLRDLGNTIVVVEHDEATIRMADHVIDMGPGAGAEGGRVVAEGTVEEILKSPDSLTGKYLTGKLAIPLPGKRRDINPSFSLVVKGARANNLKNLTVPFPLGRFICVTGVSGSGKSTLVNEVLCRALLRKFYHSKERPGGHEAIFGAELLDKVVVIDQMPIGRTPRSNPATYTALFSHVRDLFSRLTESKIRGYSHSRFSFNTKGGRCEACRGDGILRIEMHFLPDVYVPCEVCKGRRYNRETLEVLYKGKSIADVLDMTVAEAREHFANIPRVKEKLDCLHEVGLGYVRLGQPATNLSGGEAQRVKLAAELSRKGTGRTLYFLDEPTTGLHFADIHKLTAVLQKLVDQGNTVIVIEHNLDVVKQADFVIDLGPEGGEKGGRVVAAGTPEEVARVAASHTGRVLRDVLK